MRAPAFAIQTRALARPQAEKKKEKKKSKKHRKHSRHEKVDDEDQLE